MSFKQFILIRPDKKVGSKYKTVNLDLDLHQFFKKTASHYDISMADLLHNILSDWKQEYQGEIKKDMINSIDD